MKILALDTTGQVASVALADEEKLIGEYTINYKMTHSQTIMPMVDAVVKMTDFDLSTVDYIACSQGPGSFTGLRIGAATAKGLALGLNKKIVPVPTLDALAYNIFETDKIICPIMDARRSQVYTALYQWEDGELQNLTGHIAVSIDEIIERAEEFDMGVIFLGDGVPVHKEKLLKNENFTLAPPSCNMQKAGAVASLAFEIAKNGGALDGGDFTPIYIRKPQAERELLEKQAMEGKNND